MEAYKHSQHELEILHLLARGEEEIEAGKGYDLEAVLAEADSPSYTRTIRQSIISRSYSAHNTKNKYAKKECIMNHSSRPG